MKALLLISACAVIALPVAALAQGGPGPGHGGGGGWSHGGGGNGGGAHAGSPRFAAGASVQRFAGGDFDAWRGGHWYHGAISGNFGWWWWADGFWYWYAAPVYPYPMVVADTYVTDEDYAGPPTSGPVWYYCHGPEGYYPYVRACSSGWQVVPATPPDYRPAGPPPDQSGPPPGDDPGQGPPPPPQGPPPSR
jgi:hypothetical protein